MIHRYEGVIMCGGKEGRSQKGTEADHDILFNYAATLTSFSSEIVDEVSSSGIPMRETSNPCSSRYKRNCGIEPQHSRNCADRSYPYLFVLCLHSVVRERLDE